MKKLSLLVMVILAVFLMASLTFAQAESPRPFSGLFIKKADTPKLKDATPSADLLTLTSGLPFNLSGDTLYRARAGSFDFATGIDLATYKNFLILRAELSQSTTGAPFAGVGLNLNVPTLMNMIGMNWTATYINPSVGVIPGYDFTNSRFDVGILVSIVQVTF